MFVHVIRPYAGRESHKKQMLGASASIQTFRREEVGDKPEPRILSAENIGDKASSSVDRKPQQKKCMCVLWQMLSHFGSGDDSEINIRQQKEVFIISGYVLCRFSYDALF